MAKKYYCQNCQNPIEEGKQVKCHHKRTNYSSRYSSGPGNHYTYYLCWSCFKKRQEETQAQNKKVWGQVGWGLLIFLIVLVVFIVLFFLYQYHQDRKTDRIAKKSQKK